MDNIPQHDTGHLRTYYLAYGRALNISGLELEVFGSTTRTIRHWLRGEQGLPRHHLPVVLAWANARGYDPKTQYDPII